MGLNSLLKKSMVNNQLIISQYREKGRMQLIELSEMNLMLRKKVPRIIRYRKIGIVVGNNKRASAWYTQIDQLPVQLESAGWQSTPRPVSILTLIKLLKKSNQRKSNKVKI